MTKPPVEEAPSACRRRRLASGWRLRQCPRCCASAWWRLDLPLPTPEAEETAVGQNRWHRSPPGTIPGFSRHDPPSENLEEFTTRRIVTHGDRYGRIERAGTRWTTGVRALSRLSFVERTWLLVHSFIAGIRETLKRHEGGGLRACEHDKTQSGRPVDRRQGFPRGMSRPKRSRRNVVSCSRL